MVKDILDEVKRCYKIKSDRQLAAALGVSPPYVSKLRKGTLPFGPVVILHVHDATGWPIKQIKDLLCAGTKP